MRYEDKSFTAELVTVDGNEFVRCIFTDCTVRYAGGSFRFDDCRFESSGQLSLGGNADNTVAFLRMLLAHPSMQFAVASALGAPVEGVGSH